MIKFEILKLKCTLSSIYLSCLVDNVKKVVHNKEKMQLLNQTIEDLNKLSKLM